MILIAISWIRNFLNGPGKSGSSFSSRIIQSKFWTAVPPKLEPFDGSSGGQATIGFWDYTIVRELGPMPLYMSIVPEGQTVRFYWSGVGTNYVYTLEGKESLASTNWLALSGAAWPLKTNHWALPLANTPARFYRIRAESPIWTANLHAKGLLPIREFKLACFGTGARAESAPSRPTRRFNP